MVQVLVGLVSGLMLLHVMEPALELDLLERVLAAVSEWESLLVRESLLFLVISEETRSTVPPQSLPPQQRRQVWSPCCWNSEALLVSLLLAYQAFLPIRKSLHLSPLSLG